MMTKDANHKKEAFLQRELEPHEMEQWDSLSKNVLAFSQGSGSWVDIEGELDCLISKRFASLWAPYEDKEDLRQNVFVSFFEWLTKNSDKLLELLRTIADLIPRMINTIITRRINDFLRKRIQHLDFEKIIWSVTPHYQGLKKVIDEKVDSLPKTDAEVYKGHEYGDSNHEIAERLGLKEKTVRNKLCAVKKILRQFVIELLERPPPEWALKPLFLFYKFVKELIQKACAVLRCRKYSLALTWATLPPFTANKTG